MLTFYSFAMCSLYQNTLYIDRALVTDWAAALMRSSRVALWASVASIRDMIVEMVEDELVTLLPLSMYIPPCVLLTLFTYT